MRKKKPNLPKFPLSKEAIEIHQQSIKDAPDPSKILAGACDYRKLLVLKNHPSLNPIGEWLKQRIDKWIKVSSDKQHIAHDIKSEIYIDMVKKSIPRLAESEQWVYYLESYLNHAARGFFNNFLRKYYGEEDEAHSEVTDNEITGKRDKPYLDILLDPSITDKQRKIMLLIGEGPEKTHEEIGEELKISVKTVQRRLKDFAQNEALIENLRKKPSLGKKIQDEEDQEITYSHEPEIRTKKESIQCPHCEAWFKPKVKPADIECPCCYKKLK